MRIKKIQLKNGYKRFHDLTIDLGDNPKRIVALVGPNGCGKSSVFDGMLFLNKAYNGRLGNSQDRNYEFHSMNADVSYNYSNISIEFDQGTFRNIHDTKRKIGKERTIFSFRSPYRYNSNLKITETRSIGELRLNYYGASSTIDIDSKMEENYRRLQIAYNTYLHKKDCKPSEAKSKIIGDINNSLEKCLNLRISSLGDIQDNKGSIYFIKEDHPKEFDFNVLSAGEKEVVDLLLDLYLRQDEYNDSTYLIDEPELHISTSIQKKLLIEINRLIPPDCQIWVATHSIGFLRGLQDNLSNECQIIEFEQGNNWASTPYVLTPIKKNRRNWQRIFNTALDDLTGLISPKRIVYCEGKDRPGRNGEESGFDAKVFNSVEGHQNQPVRATKTCHLF